MADVVIDECPMIARSEPIGMPDSAAWVANVERKSRNRTGAIFARRHVRCVNRARTGPRSSPP